MIVCHCRVVSDRVVAEAIEDGHRSVAAVCRATGAAQDCGACVFSVKRLVCEHGAALVPAMAGSLQNPLVSEVDVAAS